MSAGILIDRQELQGIRAESYTFPITPPVGFLISHVTRFSESGEASDVPVTDPEGFDVTINPLLEKFTFKVCVELALKHEISLNFRGDLLGLNMVFGNKIQNLEFVNLFSNATGISYQTASGTAPDWSLVGSTTDLGTLASAIAALPSGAYSVRVNITGYVSGSEAVGIFRYTPSVDNLAAPQYQFQGISQDVWIAFDKRISVTSLVSSRSPATTFRYAVATSQSQIDSEVNWNITSIAALNAVVASLPAATPYAIGIYATYSGSFTSDLVTFNYAFI
jgi:hypothetical protein